MASAGDSPLLRVYVWCLPRTLGTAFIKCMSFVDDVQIFNEPFVSAYHFGPEGKAANPEQTKFIESAAANQTEFENAFNDSECTYGWVKRELQAEYPDKKILLVKDQAYCLDAKYEMIPSGFRHVFLIRHPCKVLPSWKRMLAKLFKLDNDVVTWTELLNAGSIPSNSYEMQFELLKYVKESLDPNAIVLDADDLQSNPASILRQFCEGVGIPFTESFLEWPAGRDIMKTWKAGRIPLQGNLLADEGGFYEDALKSRNFLPLKPTPNLSDISHDLQGAIKSSMKFYEQMREIRLRP